MYDLSISPLTIYFLIFSNISIQMKLKYFDADEEIFKEEMITPNLYNDLNFFQRYKSIKMKDKGVCKRTTRKGLEIKGEFIINQTPKSIYMRMKRHYGGKLPWFTCTPKIIIALSMHNKANSN